MFCLVFNAILSQELSEKLSTINDFKAPNSPGAHHVFPQKSFRTVCTPSSSFEPLWVVGGIVYENYEIARKILDPNNIENITVLKGSSAIQFSCKPIDRGIIVVTTKQNRIREFIVKDFLDGSIIAGATVTFMSKDKKDTLMGLTNDRGVITIDKLKTGNDYEIQVSSIGYKDVSIPYKSKYATNVREILMERDIKNCSEAIVSSSGKHIRCFCRGCVPWRVYKSELVDSTQKNTDYKTRVYPNPVENGNSIKVELLSNNESHLKLRMINMAGNILYEQKQKMNLGLNRISVALDSRWASGTYVIELINEKNEKIHQQKLIIQ